MLLLLALAAPLSAQTTITADFAASDLTRPGDAVPLELTITNAGIEPLDHVRLASNQLFTYDVAVTVPAGQVRRFTLPAWHFDGPLTFAGAGITLEPRRLPRDAALLLFDPSDFRAEQMTDHLGTWSLHYFPPQDHGGAAGGRAWPRPASLDRSAVPLLKDSAVAGLILPATDAHLAKWRRPAALAGVDLWTIDGDGATQLAEAVPASLRRLLDGDPQMPYRARWKGCVRSDLFDLSSDENPTVISSKLLTARPPRQPAAARLRLLLPAVAAAVVLVCLAALSFLLPTRVMAVAVLTVSLAASAWAAAVAARSETVRVDTVTVVVCDAPSGRAWAQDVAMVTAVRRGETSLEFAPRAGLPRPLMVADVDRPVYQGLSLERRGDEAWSVHGLDMRPGLMLAFAADRWLVDEFPAGDAAVDLQETAPEVRLTSRRALTGACLYAGGRAWLMAPTGAPGVYRAAGPPSDPTQLAYAAESGRPAIARRAMRWVAANVLRPGTAVFFGWEVAGGGVESPTPVADHDRLIVWIVPR